MTHWSDYSIRGWLSFLAFMHIGMSLRSFFDSTFLYNKIFSLPNVTAKEPILIRFFGVFSLSQAFILLQAAIHLYVLPVQIITMFALFAFVGVILLEAVYFQTLDLYGGTLLPCAMSIVSLVWLSLFHYVWKPWLTHTTAEDVTFKALLMEGKKKCRNTPEQFYRIQNEFIKRTAKIHSE